MIPAHSASTALSLLILLGVTTLLTSEASASYALEEWNMETRTNLPVYLGVWLLGVLLPANLASVFFVRNHVAARWVLGGFFCSHLWLTIVEVTGAFTVQGGLVSLERIHKSGNRFCDKMRDKSKAWSTFAIRRIVNVLWVTSSFGRRRSTPFTDTVPKSNCRPHTAFGPA